ncbi:MAG: hypothetical protein JXR58_00240 [Bacteroidales bacterium]|nr:hypothetical protein [Bacteroidales bacterium]
MKKSLYISISALFIALLVLSSCNKPSLREVENEVLTSLIENNIDSNIVFDKVELEETNEYHTYEGIVKTTEYGKNYQYNIKVVLEVDGKHYSYELY